MKTIKRHKIINIYFLKEKFLELINNIYETLNISKSIFIVQHLIYENL